MIVVDANVIAYLVIAGDRTALAQEARKRDAQWLVPSLWRHELLNILATYVRGGGAPVAAAADTWRQALSLLAGQEQEPAPEQVLLLAVEHQISAYDAQYVTLAISRSLPLLSEDRGLQRKFPAVVRSLQDFCA
jgi:predicted nucleic acid-binding protein